jgi:hypothetical protein
MYTDQIIQDCYEKLIPVYEKHLKFEKVNSLDEFKKYFIKPDMVNDETPMPFISELMEVWNSDIYKYSRAYYEFPVYLYNYICDDMLSLNYCVVLQKVPTLALCTDFESDMELSAKCIIEYLLHKYFNANIYINDIDNMVKYASILYVNIVYRETGELSNPFLDSPATKMIISDYSNKSIITTNEYLFTYRNLNYKRLTSACKDIIDRSTSQLHRYPFCRITFDKDSISAYSIDDENTPLYKITVKFEKEKQNEKV